MDHITDNTVADIAIASAFRAFISDPAIASILRAAVTEAAAAEVKRVMSPDHILSVVSSALTHPYTDAQSRFSDILGDVVRKDIEEATRYYLTEDGIRDFLRDEMDDGARWFSRCLDTAIENAIDLNDIADTVKSKIEDDLDISDLDSKIADKIIDHFNDDDNVLSVARAVASNLVVAAKPSL